MTDDEKRRKLADLEHQIAAYAALSTREQRLRINDIDQTQRIAANLRRQLAKEIPVPRKSYHVSRTPME